MSNPPEILIDPSAEWIKVKKNPKTGETIVTFEHARHSTVLFSYWVACAARLYYWLFAVIFTMVAQDLGKGYFYLIPVAAFVVYLIFFRSDRFPIFLSRRMFQWWTRVRFKDNMIYVGRKWIPVETASFSVEEFFTERNRKDLEMLTYRGRYGFCRRHRLGFKKIVLFFNRTNFCDVANVESQEMAMKIVLVLSNAYEQHRTGMEKPKEINRQPSGGRIVVK